MKNIFIFSIGFIFLNASQLLADYYVYNNSKEQYFVFEGRGKEIRSQLKQQYPDYKISSFSAFLIVAWNEKEKKFKFAHQTNSKDAKSAQKRIRNNVDLDWKQTYRSSTYKGK